MNIAEVKAKKLELEKQIRLLLEEFAAETGLAPTRIEIDVIPSTSVSGKTDYILGLVGVELGGW